jgi:hypothetical protein
MISVDNFYYVLYKNLLEPSNFYAKYFYPFGSTSDSNLRTNFSTDNRMNCSYSHTVLFYDQEPLLVEELPLLDFRTKTCNILANSEKSQYKKSLSKKYCLLDWYYFYHGFAALDWFRDFQYLPEVEYQYSKVFISLNRLHTNYRSYRLNLISEYVERNLLDKGHVSFASTNHEFGHWEKELSDPNTLLPTYKLNKIKNNLGKLRLPLIVDTDSPVGSASSDSGPNAIRLNQSALWHVVSETIFYQEKLHLTEKIFKPICSRRPFILVGAKGNLSYLKSYGFKTFEKWIDESYDNEPDHDKRIIMIVDEIEKLCKLNFKELRSMHEDMKEILNFNFHHFYNEFKQIIVSEMMDNFQTCLKIWNHDRLNDDKINLDLTVLYNVKKLLLQ